jgi:hypothetical protein
LKFSDELRENADAAAPAENRKNYRRILLRAWPFLPIVIIWLAAILPRPAASLLGLLFFVAPGFLVWTLVGAVFSWRLRDRMAVISNGLGLLLAIVFFIALYSGGVKFHI